MNIPKMWPDFEATIIKTSGVCTISSVAGLHTHMTKCLCASGNQCIAYKHAGVAYCSACGTYFSYDATENAT